MNPYQLDAHAECHDKLVRADGGKEDPNPLHIFLEPDGQALKDGVQAQGQDGEKVPGRSKHLVMNDHSYYISLAMNTTSRLYTF